MNQRKAKHAKARVLQVQRTTVGIPEDVHIKALAKASRAAEDWREHAVEQAKNVQVLAGKLAGERRESTRLLQALTAAERERDEARAVNTDRLLQTRTFFVLGSLAGIALTNLIFLAIQAI